MRGRSCGNNKTPATVYERKSNVRPTQKNHFNAGFINGIGHLQPVNKDCEPTSLGNTRRIESGLGHLSIEQCRELL